MVKLYLRNCLSFLFLIYVASIIQMYYFYYSANGVPLDYWMMQSNNVPVYVNSAFLVFSIYNVKIIKRTHTSAILRLGGRKIIHEYMKVSILNIVVYFGSIYLPIILLNRNFIQNFPSFYMHIFNSIFTFAIYELIYIRFIITSEDNVSILLPILINFVQRFLTITM